MNDALLELIEPVFLYLSEVDDEVGPCEVAAKFKIKHDAALEILKKLHRDERLACAGGCDICEG